MTKRHSALLLGSQGLKAFVTEWILAFPKTKDGEFSNQFLASQHNKFTQFKPCPQRPVCGLVFYLFVVSANTEFRSMEVLMKYVTGTCDGD